MGTVAPYNPNDPEQKALLSAIAYGESRGHADPYNVGFGGVNLGSASRDRYGFPQWGGAVTSAGPTHAAGAFQFQPGTWRRIASRYGLDFRSEADQNAGAWYLAQEDYFSRTGRSLDSDLDAKDLSRINSTLQPTWASAKGSDFAGLIAKGVGAEIAPGSSSGNLGTPAPSITSDPIGWAARYFVRGGMIIVGVVVIGIALWALLSHYDMAPKIPGVPV